MVKLKFLVTGSAGLIGRQVVKDLSETHEVFSCYNKSKPEFGVPTKMDLLALITLETPQILYSAVTGGTANRLEQ